jgi:hypothetical protein
MGGAGNMRYCHALSAILHVHISLLLSLQLHTYVYIVPGAPAADTAPPSGHAQSAESSENSSGTYFVEVFLGHMQPSPF